LSRSERREGRERWEWDWEKVLSREVHLARKGGKKENAGRRRKRPLGACRRFAECCINREKREKTKPVK